MDRHIYKEVLTIARGNPAVMDAPGDFFEWMRRLYIQSMTITMRRLVDRDRRTVSFVRLMEEIVDHPEILSRDRFVRGFLRTCEAVRASIASAVRGRGTSAARSSTATSAVSCGSSVGSATT